MPRSFFAALQINKLSKSISYFRSCGCHLDDHKAVIDVAKSGDSMHLAFDFQGRMIEASQVAYGTVSRVEWTKRFAVAAVLGCNSPLEWHSIHRRGF
jgi:hypothetical protein